MTKIINNLIIPSDVYYTGFLWQLIAFKQQIDNVTFFKLVCKLLSVIAI